MDIIASEPTYPSDTSNFLVTSAILVMHSLANLVILTA
jgi:hypothetical protein